MSLDKKKLFLNSALSKKEIFYSIEEILEWVKMQNQKVDVSVERINFKDLTDWNYSENNFLLRHKTGKFFTIEGIDVKTNWGAIKHWNQPIINQQEIGYLGFITKEFEGVLHFLVQAKIEPGNINFVQLSPTLQATKSNYTKAHSGKAPDYLEYFVNARDNQILLNQLQSEQGARFLRKRNRNIIIKTDDDILLKDNFIWLTLYQIKVLMAYDNVVNMDTRTVISGINYGDLEELSSTDKNDLIKTKLSDDNLFLKSTLDKKNSVNGLDDILSFVTNQKTKFELEVKGKSLSALEKWVIEKDSIRHIDDKYFRVIATNVSIGNREVINWNQPMVEPAQEGICAFVCKMINGVYHFIVQTKLECGNFDLIEFAPTVQCLTGNYRNTVVGSLPFLDYVLNVPASQIIYDVFQSEEGGRFYREQNRNMIIIAGDEVSNNLPDNYIWMSLNQLQMFIRFNNYINIQARSLIAAIKFI